MRLWLPELKAERAATQDAASPRTPTAPRTTLTVLLVDDEAGVRTLLAEILRDSGYDVIEESDGIEGLDVLHSGATINIVVTDVGMPRMNGVGMIEWARVSLPELKVLFITGYAQQQVSLEQQLDRNSHMLTKPFPMNALLERVAVIVKSSAGLSSN